MILAGEKRDRPLQKNVDQGIIVLSENFTFKWLDTVPYVTKKFRYEGEIGFIPTGNNILEKDFGTIGY